MNKFTLNENRRYWEDTNTRTLIDLNLKQLEVDFISKYLRKDFSVGDIGCGDATTVIKIAPQVKTIVGLERSDLLKKQAKEKVLNAKLKNVQIVDGDILELNWFEKFDLIITERVIINLPSWDLQLRAIDNIHTALKSKGIYIMIENTMDGHLALNKLRDLVGLKPIEMHWHNLYLEYDQFCNGVKGKFDIIERKGFSLYYFLTRIYTQMFATFEGFGINAKKDKIFEVSDKAAKEIQDKMENNFVFTGNEKILGPIQGISLRKISD